MTRPDAINPCDDGFIDRIVDGEMTPAELRAAIDRLDRVPDGWKRCTLAFLEAQCWRESLRPIGESGSSAAGHGSLSFTTESQASPGNRVRWIRGPIAAGVIAASFALGWAGHAARPWSGTVQTPMAATGTQPKPVEIGSRSEPLHDEASGRTAPARFVDWQPGEKQSLPTAKEVLRAVGLLHFGAENTGADVPILAGPGIDEKWLRNQPPPVNEYAQVALQRQGYQVDQRRRLVTTTLADGRRVTVPIDQVQIRYTGNNPL